MTPRVLPEISVPANCFLPFSTCPATSPSRVFVQATPSQMFLAPTIIAEITSSFTALEFAPGALNTTIPSSAHLSRGILLTPAPALPIASRLSEKSISCILKLRTTTPCAVSISSVNSYLSVSLPRPTWEMLLSVPILNLSILKYLLLPPELGGVVKVLKI